MTWVHGVDVSRWQAPGLALPDGIAFAWIKASQGGGRDRHLRAHHADLTRRGIKVGAYCYYDFGTTPERNAETFLAATAGLHWDLPHALDAEDDTGASRAAVATALLRFLHLVEDGTGRVPVVYTGRFWWQSKVGADQRFARHPLWLAGYPKPNDGTPPREGRTYPVPAPWTGHDVWQYSDSSGRLDRNVATPAAYARLLGHAPAPPAPTPTDPGDLTMAQIDDLYDRLGEIETTQADHGRQLDAIHRETVQSIPPGPGVKASGRWLIGDTWEKYKVLATGLRAIGAGVRTLLRLDTAEGKRADARLAAAETEAGEAA